MELLEIREKLENGRMWVTEHKWRWASAIALGSFLGGLIVGVLV